MSQKHLRICEVCLLGPPGVGKTALVEEALKRWCNDVGSWGINLGYWNYVWFNYGSCNLKVPTLKLMVNMPYYQQLNLFLGYPSLEITPVFCILRCWLENWDTLLATRTVKVMYRTFLWNLGFYRRSQIIQWAVSKEAAISINFPFFFPQSRGTQWDAEIRCIHPNKYKKQINVNAHLLPIVSSWKSRICQYTRAFLYTDLGEFQDLVNMQCESVELRSFYF